MSEDKKPRLKAMQEWLRLRKNTVIAHWLWGSVCGYAISQNFVASLVLLGLFAGWEAWNDRNMRIRQKDYKPEGDMDWWDSFVAYGIWLGVTLILNGCGIVSIRWY